MHKTGLAWVRGFISRYVLVWLGLIVLFALVLYWHLGNMAYSQAETTSLASAKTLHLLASNPVNAPHQVFEYALQHFHHAGLHSTRLVSIGFYLLFLGSFYMIARSWFGRFSATLGALLFGFTPLVMLLARSATSDIMYLWPLTVIGAYMIFIRSRTKSALKLWALFATAGLCLYVPGGIFFVVIGTLYVNKSLRAAMGAFSRKVQALTWLIFVALAAPLAFAIFKHPHIGKELALIPAPLPDVMDFLKWLAWAPLTLFWHSAANNYFQLGRLPVFDLIQIVFVAFGIYALWGRASGKAMMLIATVVYACLEFAFNKNYDFLVVSLPALMIFATAGLRYLHIEWNSVFPRNPLPRGLALTLLLAVVAIHVYWGVHYSLVAWPHRFALVP